jgi:hypothetical protein
MNLNWWAGAKSALAFGLGGAMTIALGQVLAESVILLLVLPGIIIGLLFAIFNRKELNDKGFFLRSPLLFSMGSLGAGALAGVVLLGLGSFFGNAKSIEIHYAWISGLIFSLIVGSLIVFGHSYSNKKVSISILTAVGTSLAFVNGLYLEESFRQNAIELPSLIWLIGFGFAVGIGLQRNELKVQ